MGYKIIYNPEEKKKYPMKERSRIKLRWCIPVMLVLSFVLALGKPQFRAKLEEWLIPGDSEVTKAAFSEMLGQLRVGENAVDAVTTFCRTIIGGSETTTVYET